MERSDLGAMFLHNSRYGETRPLNLRRKVFLSHSGRDKSFVQFLYDKLLHRYQDDVTFIFFDEESLPTAEAISMENILVEARGCELGVLVLSQDFFMRTPNPMLELEALTDNKVQLLPLFYKISVDAFNKMRSGNVWERRWKEWPDVVDVDGRIERWRCALDLVKKFSGLEYCKVATNEPDYIRQIVNKVTCIVRPAISFRKSGLFGMDRLCQIVNGMYNKCSFTCSISNHSCTQVVSTSARAGHVVEDSGDTLDLVGIYGFAGLGKTTLCECLCDFYFAEFHGKVCWIDLGQSIPSSPHSSQTYSSNAFLNRMQHILYVLTGGDVHGIHALTFSQAQNLFRNSISFMMDPIFLAIDNILPGPESFEEAHFYLSCKLAKGSKIFITARNKEILDLVALDYTKFSVVIERIPNLQLGEAMGIFKHEIPKLETLNDDVEDEVRGCVKMCIVDHKWYHPLMLKSLAASIRWDRRCNVIADWKSRLRELRAAAADRVDKISDTIWKPVFNLLDISYAVLSKDAQTVFMDLALFCRTSFSRFDSLSWIRTVHSHRLRNQKLDEIAVIISTFMI